MATIKGQNLRLFANGKCVAASTSASLHLAATVEDKTTKDTDGEWTENACTGKSWDASADALVVIKRELSADLDLSTGVVNNTYLIDTDHPIYAKKGETIEFDLNGGGELYLLDQDFEPVTTAQGTELNYDIDEDFYGWCAIAYGEGQPGEGSFDISTDEEAETANTVKDWFEYITEGTRLTLAVDMTATIAGTHNRTVRKTMMTGKCYLTDISITAQNRADSTLTVQFTGDGEPTFEDQ